jgi:uncharacterized protein (TIGR02246 family)
MNAEEAARKLHGQLVDGWNAHDAQAMADAVAADGLVVGFDGSQMLGSEAVATELGAVFADHETATYVTKVRSVTELGGDAALLHAVSGMVPPGGSELMEERNQIQTVVARRTDGEWKAALFQTTPARFDGRPELTEKLSAELGELLPAS